MKAIGTLKIKSSDEIQSSRMSIGFECLDRDLFDPELCYDRVKESGAKFARCQTGWARTETERGVYDFSWLDSVVNNLLARGIQPWFDVGYGNPLYMPDAPNPTAVGCPPLLYGEAAMDAWRCYVEALCRHFGDRVTHYEIWNEPDISHFWHPEKADGERFGEFYKFTSDVILSILPDSKLGFSTSESNGEYLKKVFEQISPRQIDFLSMHNYERKLELGSRYVGSHSGYDFVRELLDEYGLYHVELWMGEGGHASWHPVGHGQCPLGGGSEHRQAVWILRRAFGDLRKEIRLTSIFMIVDLWQKPYQMAQKIQRKPAAQGLLRGITYEPKPGFYTFSRLCTVLGGETLPLLSDMTIALSTPLSNSEPSPITVCYLHDGCEVYAYWMPYAIEEERGITKTATASLDPASDINDPIVIDLFTGEAQAPEVGEWTPETKTLTGLPIGEYPVLICDRAAFEIV